MDIKENVEYRPIIHRIVLENFEQTSRIFLLENLLAARIEQSGNKIRHRSIIILFRSATAY